MLNLAMVYYGPHDSNIDSLIINTQPSVLIDNTPGGYWHGACNPQTFQSRGIKVFSYIYSGYDSIPASQNQALINAIAGEGSYGVFIDECNPSATGALTSLCNYAHNRGLKVIINPGTSAIDAGLYNIADYVMTDEHYTGRPPNSVEASHLNQTIVIGYDGSWSAETAAAYTKAAWGNGFALSWHTLEYVSLPYWLQEYTGLIAPASFSQPVVSVNPLPTVTSAPIPATVVTAGISSSTPKVIAIAAIIGGALLIVGNS
jgi:hypothetical protein